MIRNKMMNTI